MNDDLKGLWMNALQESGAGRKAVASTLGEPMARTDWSEFMKLKIAGILAATALLGACMSDADRASQNLSTAADNFEVTRRVIFYNGITGDYMLTIEGLCSRGNGDAARQVTVTCKVGPTAYKKHFLGLSDNVTYFIEQMEPVKASAYHYRVIFKPANIIPDIEVK
jgi:hypothetical protein